MSLYVARVGDIAGAAIVNGANSVTANGIPVATLGSVVANGSTIANGSSTVFVEGKPLARFGDVTTKGNTIANGSLDVVAGG